MSENVAELVAQYKSECHKWSPALRRENARFIRRARRYHKAREAEQLRARQVAARDRRDDRGSHIIAGLFLAAVVASAGQLGAALAVACCGVASELLK